MLQHCDECNSPRVNYTNNRAVYGRPLGRNPMIYLCLDCGARVGTRANGSALGRMANEATRHLRKVAHGVFDRIWQEGHMTRGEAYQWLSERLDIPKKQCHMAMMPDHLLKKVPNIAGAFLEGNMSAFSAKKSITELIDEFHEKQNEAGAPRGHLGISGLGRTDDAGLWLNYRWAFKQKFKGRTLRLFRRGHNEELVVVNDLISAGLDVRDYGRNQRNFDFGWGVKGSADGVILGGVPEAPATAHLLEIKTMNAAAFNRFRKHGLKKANFMYWVQVHCYMFAANLDRCLFTAVCKDNDQMHFEIVEADRQLAIDYINRGKYIAQANELPDLPDNPSAFDIKFSEHYALFFPDSATNEHWERLCDARSVAEGTPEGLAKVQVNWRTDAHSRPTETGDWHNSRISQNVPFEHQAQAWEGHILNPEIMQLFGWRLLNLGQVAHYALPDGREVFNGAPDYKVFTSEELLTNIDLCASAPKEILDVRQATGGRITASQR